MGDSVMQQELFGDDELYSHRLEDKPTYALDYERPPGGWLKQLAGRQLLIARTDGDAIKQAQSMLAGTAVPMSGGAIRARAVRLLHLATGRELPLSSEELRDLSPQGTAD